MILPQQLQMLKINENPDDKKRRRGKQALDNYKTGRDLLELRAHKEKYKRLDEEMISIISEKATGRCRDILVTLWYEDTKKEEEISEKRWKSKNEVWLKQYETDFRIKYADKNPFIKENEEIGIYRQTYPPRRQRQTRYPQGRTRSQSPVNRDLPRNNLNRLPRNNGTAILRGPLYSEIVQRSRQEQGSYYQRFKTKTNLSWLDMPNSQIKQFIRYFTKTSYEEGEKLPERHNRFSKSFTLRDFRINLISFI